MQANPGIAQRMLKKAETAQLVILGLDKPKGEGLTFPNSLGNEQTEHLKPKFWCLLFSVKKSDLITNKFEAKDVNSLILICA